MKGPLCYNQNINYNNLQYIQYTNKLNIYTIIDKNCTLLYRMIRENATPTIIVILKMGIYSIK